MLPKIKIYGKTSKERIARKLEVEQSNTTSKKNAEDTFILLLYFIRIHFWGLFLKIFENRRQRRMILIKWKCQI